MNLRIVILFALVLAACGMFVWTIYGQVQVPAVTAVVNAASFTPSLAPGVLAMVLGSNLSNPTTVPVSVMVNGRFAAVLYTSPAQLNIQVPVDATTGTTELQVTTASGSSVPFPIMLNPYAPGIFTLSGSGSGMGFFVHPNGTMVSDAAPARPGETLILYAVGLGPTTPPVATGMPSPASPLAVTNAPVTVSVGGVDSAVLFSGLAPGSIGLYQVNFQVPGSLAPGTHSVVLRVSGVSSNTVSVPLNVLQPTAVFRDAAASIRLNRHGATQLYWAGGILAGDPAAAQNSGGDTFMVARAANGNLWSNVFSASSLTWGTWRWGGGITKGTPAVGVPPSGIAWVAARGTYDDFWLTSFTAGGFGGWLGLGGIFTSDPALAACPDGGLYIVGRDTTGGVWSSRYIPGTGFFGWQFGGGIINGKPSVACGSDSAAYIAVRDVYNSLWFARVFGTTWTGWYYGGGLTSADPQVASLGSSISLVILDPWGRVWRSGFTLGPGNNWQPWVYVGGVLQDVSAAGLPGELFFVGRSPYNDIWWWRQSGSQWTGIGGTGIAAGPLSAAPR